jgi:hypothetical protein
MSTLCRTIPIDHYPASPEAEDRGVRVPCSGAVPAAEITPQTQPLHRRFGFACLESVEISPCSSTHFELIDDCFPIANLCAAV